MFQEIFETVFVPSAVHAELTESGTPEKVRKEILSLPRWYEVRTVQAPAVPSFPVTLHRGEREAILLAESLRGDVLLIDDQAGRGVALARKLPVSGTLGLVERADSIGLISDFPKVVEELKASGFFIGETLEQQLLGRYLKRKANK